MVDVTVDEVDEMLAVTGDSPEQALADTQAEQRSDALAKLVDASDRRRLQPRPSWPA